MFSPADRDRLRDTLVRQAQRDPQIVSAAVVGSAARSAEDRWSDIDLALRLRPGVSVEAASETWTEWLGSVVGIVDSLDVSASGGLYRVFLLEDSLQVDLSFFPFDEFRATNGEPFQLLFGAITDALARTRAVDIERTELIRSLHSVGDCFLREVAEWDSSYRDRLEPALVLIGSTAEADT